MPLGFAVYDAVTRARMENAVSVSESTVVTVPLPAPNAWLSEKGGYDKPLTFLNKWVEKYLSE